MNTTRTKGSNRGVAPVTYGTGDRPPRGDYGRARSDYTCEQDHARYTAADHDTYRRLHARQLQQLPGLACDAFIAAVQHLGPPEQIPRFDAVSEKLMRTAGWQLVAVPGWLLRDRVLRPVVRGHGTRLHAAVPTGARAHRP